MKWNLVIVFACLVVLFLVKLTDKKQEDVVVRKAILLNEPASNPFVIVKGER